MSRNILKYIALLAMTLDHIAYYLYPELNGLYIISRFVGRIAFPIMCLFIADGYKYTSSKGKYLLRLSICAIITQIPVCLLEGTINVALNPIFSLLVGYLYLIILNSNIKLRFKTFTCLLLLVISLITNYWFLGIIYIIGFYYFKRNSCNSIIIILIGYLITTLRLFISLDNINLIIINSIINLGLFLVVFINTNGCKQKREGNFKKYFFYLYYPLHLFIIYLITLFL